MQRIWLINDLVVWIHMFYKCHINLLVSLTLFLIFQIEKMFNRSWTKQLLTFTKKWKKGALESWFQHRLWNTKLQMGVYIQRLEEIRSKICIEILSKMYISECICKSTYHFYCKITFGRCNFFGKSFLFSIIISNNIVYV